MSTHRIIRIALCLSLVLLFLASAQEITYVDDFATFDTRPSSVAIEDVWQNAPWKLWSTGDAAHACGDGILRLELKGAGEFRLTCKQGLESTNAGACEMRVRFTGLGNGNLFLGAATVVPWMKYGAVLYFSNQKTMTFGDKRNVFRCEDGTWYTFRIDWNFGDMTASVDGRRVANATIADAPSGLMPLVVLNSRGKPFCVEIDSIRFEGYKPRQKSNTLPAVVDVPIPALPPTLPEPPAMTPKAAVDLAARQATLENRFLRVCYDWSSGSMQLREWTNRFSRRQILSRPSPFFAVQVDGGRYLQDFRVTECSAASSRLVFHLLSQDGSIAAVYTVGFTDDERELQAGVAVKNRSDRRRTLAVVHPFLQGLRMSSAPQDDAFFYPFESGMAGALDCQLGHVYGVTALMQVMSVFAPREGGSFYAYPLDRSGGSKLLALRRQASAAPVDVIYEPVASDEPIRTAGLLDRLQGTSLAWKFQPSAIPAGGECQVPPSILGCGPSDWRDGLVSYGRFIRTWWKKQVATPQWYQECFSSLSGHPNGNMHLLSPKRFNGYFNKHTMQYDYAAQMGPWERNCVMEFAYWNDYDPERSMLPTWELVKLPIKGAPLVNNGCYEVNRTRGGLEPLRREIEDVHAKGGYLMLYTFPEAVGIGSEIDRLVDGRKLAAIGRDGEYASNYVGKGLGWFLCFYEPDYSLKIGARFARLVRETGCDGIRLDTMARLYECHNPAHRHLDGTPHGFCPPEQMAQTLLNFKRLICEANPDAAVTTEHAGTDHILQFIDSFYSQGIHWLSNRGRWAPFRRLNAYQMVFSRFVFPEAKVWIHSHYDKHESGRMSIFNGVGDCVTTAVEAVAAKTLEENADTFASAEAPVPLVPTLHPAVFANKFTGGKTIYSVYNRGDKAIDAPVLRLPASECHYVDVYREAPCAVTRDGAFDCIAVALPANEVSAIAVFPRLLEAKIANGRLRLALAKPVADAKVEVIYGEDDFLAVPPQYRLREEGLDLPLRPGVGKVIVKLKAGRRLLDEVILAQ